MNEWSWRSPGLRRLFLLFSLGIFLPSLLLIVLGFSSLQAEKRLRENAVAERLGTRVGDWQKALEDALQSAMAAHAGWQGSAVMDAQGHWIEPFRQAVPFSWPALPPHHAARLSALERLERIDKDYAKAADGYSLLAWNLESAPWKAALLLRAAGCWRKMHAWPQAEEALDHIGRRYAELRNGEGLPFGLLVATELAQVYAASGHLHHGIDKALDTFTNLERGLWALTWKDESLFAQRLHEHLREWSPSMTVEQESRWHALGRAVNLRAERVAMLEHWQANEWPHVQTLLEAAGRRDRPSLVWPEHSADLAVWINPAMDARTGRLLRTQIAWCDPAAIEALWRHSPRGLSDQAGFTAQLSPVSHNGVDGVKCQLNTMVPPMELRLRASGSSGDAYASTRRILFGAMILMAGVIFMVSLGVTWQILARGAHVEAEAAWLKARFVDTLSQKIQTPLSVIEFIAQKMRLKSTKNPQDAQAYYALLREDTLRLKRVIDDVLDFARVMDERVPYPFTRFDWALSLRQLVDAFGQSAVGRKGPIHFSSSLTPCWIEGHEEALSRAVRAIFENAVHYSPPERVTIQVAMRRDGDYGVLDITDQGDGISPREQAVVFDRFSRGASAQERRVPGAGLGLALARYIIQAHHGTLTLQSALRKGSTFTLRLPLFPLQ